MRRDKLASQPEPDKTKIILVSAGKDGLYGTADDISNYSRVRLRQ